MTQEYVAAPRLSDWHTRRVGQPVQELSIQEGVLNSVEKLFPGGSGTKVFAISEVSSRFGRADLLVAHVCSKALNAQADLEFSFYSETECKLVAMLAQQSEVSRGEIARSLGLSYGYVSSLISGLRQRGLNDAIIENLLHPVVTQAWIVESKIDDWKSAILQARRYRGMVSGVAIALPSNRVSSISLGQLSRLEVGLIAVEEDTATWTRPWDFLEFGLGAQLWLNELALRYVSNSSAERK